MRRYVARHFDNLQHYDNQYINKHQLEFYMQQFDLQHIYNDHLFYNKYNNKH